MQRTFLFETRSGWCWTALSERGVRAFRLPLERREDAARLAPSLAADDRPCGELAFELVRQVRADFDGQRETFDLRLDWSGATEFCCAVWSATRAIPYGATATYGDLARKLGRPGAARAVGRALGANPIPLIVPCHRVIAANGALCGFSAEGGAEVKRRLLDFEAGA